MNQASVSLTRQDGACSALNNLPKRLALLRVTDIVMTSNPEYTQFSRPKINDYDITFLTYFDVEMPMLGVRVIEGPSNPFGFIRQIRRVLRAGYFDIIHLHSPYMGNFFLAATALNSRLRRRTIYTVHNSYPSYRLKHKLLMLTCFAAFQRIVFCSEASYASFPAPFRWLVGKRGIIIQNGVNVDLIDESIARMSTPSPDKPFTVGWIGRLIPIKNTITSLKAFKAAAAPQDKMIVMGDGPLKSDLVASASALGLNEQVLFTGLIPREDVFGHLVDCDVYVSSSYGEGLPIAVLEAMACRRPVILSDIAPHREITQRGNCIALVAPDDVDGFAQEIARIRMLSPEDRQALGERCRQVVDKHFSVNAMLDKYENEYRHVMAQDV